MKLFRLLALLLAFALVVTPAQATHFSTFRTFSTFGYGHAFAFTPSYAFAPAFSYAPAFVPSYAPSFAPSFGSTSQTRCSFQSRHFTARRSFLI